MAFWDDWQKNKNPITWSEGFQHGYKKIPKSSTPSSEELSLAKANKKLVGKEKLDESMQRTVQKVVKNMVKEGITSGRFDKNKPRDLVEFSQKFIDKPSNKTSLSSVVGNALSDSTKKDIKSPEAFNKGIAKFVKDLTGKNIDPTKAGSFNEFVQHFTGSDKNAEAIKKAIASKPTADSAVKGATPKEGVANTSNKNETAIKKAIQPRTISGESVDSGLRKLNQKYTKYFARSWMKNSYDNNGNLKGISETVPRSSNTLSPRQLGSLVRGGINGVMANAGNISTMPLPGDPEKNRDRLRVENHPEDLSSVDTVVPMNPQGTVYLDPELGIQNTEVVEDYEGGRYYRNAQTGQFEPLDYNPRYSTYVPLPRVKKVYPTDSNGVPYLNDILGGVLSMPMSTTPLPIPPMHYNSDANKPLPSMSTDEGEIPSGTVEVGPDKEVSAQPVNKPNVASVVRQRRAPKPGVINDTPAANVTPVFTPTPPVAAPTLSSVASQAVRHNGGFDNYRRESVLSALRAAGGISPAEAVQRGIIPWEALNYV